MPSTVIRSFVYRPETSELEVLFTTGRRYVYEQVPPEAAEALRTAFAKGRHFNARIRGRYSYRELDPSRGAGAAKPRMNAPSRPVQARARRSGTFIGDSSPTRRRDGV